MVVEGIDRFQITRNIMRKRKMCVVVALACSSSRYSFDKCEKNDEFFALQTATVIGVGPEGDNIRLGSY